MKRFLFLLCLLILSACTQFLESPIASGDELFHINLPDIPLGGLTPGHPPRMVAVKVPEIGEEYISQGYVTMNVSNTDRGYVKIRNEAENSEAFVRIEKYGFYPCTFNLPPNGEWGVFPLARGEGEYMIRVWEHYADRVFVLVFSAYVDVVFSEERLPFLYPNIYVNFNAESLAVRRAAELAAGIENYFEIVRVLYDYIVRNIAFDTEFADAITEGEITEHVPNIDLTLQTGMGICFDFAVLFAAMLRSQGISARLEIGYAMGIFHAWVGVYVPGAYWGSVFHPNDDGWGILDPTTTAVNRVEGFLNPVVDVREFHTMFIR